MSTTHLIWLGQLEQVQTICVPLLDHRSQRLPVQHPLLAQCRHLLLLLLMLLLLLLHHHLVLDIYLEQMIAIRIDDPGTTADIVIVVQVTGAVVAATRRRKLAAENVPATTVSQ